ncbi:MAG TPA: hypothetical protein VIG30_13150 [Ktedonobacterales bacterium]|jgi:FtsH-binding integral membrane protein
MEGRGTGVTGMMPRVRDTANRHGLILGAILGVVFLVRSVLLSTAVQLAAGPSLVVALLYLAGLVGLPIAAGVLASRDSGKIGHGIWAGFVTGAIGGLIATVGELILTSMNPTLTLATFDVGTLQATSLCGAPILGTIGAICGIAGGLVGRLLYRKPVRATSLS